MKTGTGRAMALAAITAVTVAAGASGSGGPSFVEAAHAASSSPTNGGRSETRQFTAAVDGDFHYRYDVSSPRKHGPTDTIRTRASNKFSAVSAPFTAEATIDRHGKARNPVVRGSIQLGGQLTGLTATTYTVTHEKITKPHDEVEWRTCTSTRGESLVGAPPILMSLTADLAHRSFYAREVGHPPAQVASVSHSHCGDQDNGGSSIGSPSYMTFHLLHPDEVSCEKSGSFRSGYESTCTFERVRDHKRKRSKLTVHVVIKPA
jgi:hypothetical protein